MLMTFSEMSLYFTHTHQITSSNNVTTQIYAVNQSCTVFHKVMLN